MLKALRIHPSPYVTAGFLVAFCMLLAFLYGLPMLTSQADEGDDEPPTGKSLECSFFPEQCACNPNYCPTSTPTPTPTVDPCDVDPQAIGCSAPTPAPTTPPPATAKPTAAPPSSGSKAPPPTGVTASDPTKSSVKVTWTSQERTSTCTRWNLPRTTPTPDGTTPHTRQAPVRRG